MLEGPADTQPLCSGGKALIASSRRRASTSSPTQRSLRINFAHSPDDRWFREITGSLATCCMSVLPLFFCSFVFTCLGGCVFLNSEPDVLSRIHLGQIDTQLKNPYGSRFWRAQAHLHGHWSARAWRRLTRWRWRQIALAVAAAIFSRASFASASVRYAIVKN